jgi:hypothetical protein
MTEAVHNSPHIKDVTDDKINDCIARWFRNSTDRKGGRKQRRSEIPLGKGDDGNSSKNEEEANRQGSNESIAGNPTVNTTAGIS